MPRARDHPTETARTYSHCRQGDGVGITETARTYSYICRQGDSIEPISGLRCIMYIVPVSFEFCVLRVCVVLMLSRFRRRVLVTCILVLQCWFLPVAEIVDLTTENVVSRDRRCRS